MAEAKESVAGAAAPADGSRAREEVHSTEEELLAKHFPHFFYDHKEKHFPVDLNQYILDQSAVDGCNGVTAPSKDGKSTWLIYMNYYLRDGGLQRLGGKGGHAYDLEVVIVEVSKHKVTGVFFGPHGSDEHFWIRDPKDLKAVLGDDERPRVYVSGGKHASYPVSGKVIRLFGVGTDVCNKPTARDRPLVLLTEDSKRVDRIDGKFSGPKRKIARDWSTAGGSRLKNVRKRRAVPPASQVRKELRKLKFW